FEEGDPLSSPCARQSNPPPFSNEDSSLESPQDISPPRSPQTPLQSPHTPHHHSTVEDEDDEDDIPIAGLKRRRDEEDVEETEPSNPFPDPTAHNMSGLTTKVQPRGAICPKQLELKGIFDLDVDDTIWEDIGLEEGTPAAPPPWLADEDVRAGIKAMLEQDRCLEEEVRLQHECRSMRVWLSEEWRLVNLALGTDDESLAYHLRLRRSLLLRLCSQWQLSVHSLDFGDIMSLPDWGPSVEDILNFRNMQKTALVKDIPRTYTDSTECDNQLHCEERDEESEYSDSEHGEVDMILIDTIDAVHLADTTRSETMDNEEYLYDE
ncbi:hypothetical protein DXG01_012428, partial [Tephrocybe rancida]